jgi:uncharacterized protein
MKVLKVAILIFFFSGMLFFLTKNQKKVEIQVKDQYLEVWVSESEEERNKGLSNIDSIKNNEGMLFVFKEEIVPLFWMKDMNFPIDIIWINSEKEVVEITEEVYPETYPQTFFPSVPIKYVLEVNSGWCSEKEIKKGDKLYYEKKE